MNLPEFRDESKDQMRGMDMDYGHCGLHDIMDRMEKGDRIGMLSISSMLSMLSIVSIVSMSILSTMSTRHASLIAGGRYLRAPCQAGLLIQDFNRLCEERIRFITGITDRRQSHAPVFAQRAHHVEDDTCLSRLIEMDVVTGHNVKQIVGREDAICRRVLMIAGDETFLLAKPRGEHTAVGIIRAIGEKLQGQKRMRRSTFAQIDLNRVCLPLVLFTHRHKIDREPSQHAFAGQA